MSVGTANSCELFGSPLVTQIAVTAHTQGRTLLVVESKDSRPGECVSLLRATHTIRGGES